MTFHSVVLSNDSELKRYLESLKSIKMIDQQTEYSLAIDFFNNRTKDSGHQLVVSHLPLVVKFAYKYKGYGLSMIDLISEGNIGLMQALLKFDPYKGFRFSTYAMWWIKSYMLDFIINSWSIVRKGTLAGRKKLFFSLNKIKNKLGIVNNNISEENIKQISSELGVSKNDVLEINSMFTNRDVYLDAPISSGENETIVYGDVIESLNNNPEEEFAHKQSLTLAKNHAIAVFEILNEREKIILQKRYLQDKPMSLEAIGSILNISRERVRQIESSALKKSKTFLLSKA